MTFTDDDLSRLSLWCVWVEEHGTQDRRAKSLDYPTVVALLNRLDAAEKVCEAARMWLCGQGRDEGIDLALIEWQKLAHK